MEDEDEHCERQRGEGGDGGGMADIETRMIRGYGTPQNASRHPGLRAQAWDVYWDID